MIEIEEMVDIFIYRPIAFLLVKAVFNTRITPDNLTSGAIVAGISAGVLYAFGTPHTRISGSILFVMFIILDCSDGQLARLKKNGTPIGRLLDGIADYIVVTSVYIGIVIGYSNSEGQPIFMIALLVLSAISIIIQEVLVDFYRTRFVDVVLDKKDTFAEGVDEYRKEYKMLKWRRGNFFKKSVIFLYLIYSGVQERITPRKVNQRSVTVSSREYYNKNKLLVRSWVFIGPSAARTTLVLCLFLNRFEIFFWVIIGLFNLLAISLFVVQKLVDRSYNHGKAV